jgi:lipopolysaccharide transport system permease protein
MKFNAVAVDDPCPASASPSRGEAAMTEAELEVVIEPSSGWQPIDLRELRAYRDLIWFNTWRGVRARYAQSALGLGWAVAQPLISMLVFTLIFSRVARVPMPGNVPYPLFIFCGIVAWNFFSGALLNASNSLIANSAMLNKIYFPRLILPLSEILARFIDFALNMVFLGLMMAAYGFVPRLEALVLVPLMTGVMALAALGAGLWLSALALQYRDVAYGLNFAVQIAFYFTPFIYDSALIPARLLPFFGLNPMVGVIAVYRATLLGMPSLDGMLVAESVAVSAVLLVTGAFYFHRSERLFADVA